MSLTSTKKTKPFAMTKKKNPFEHFHSEEYRTDQNRLLIGILDVRLHEKGKLEPDDVLRAYEQIRSLIQQDVEFLAKKSCLYLNSEPFSVDPSKCCLFQLVDGTALQRDAVELVHRMWPFVLCLVCYQPHDKRLQIHDHLRIVVQIRLQLVEITSGDISTFPGLFQVLLEEMNGIDEGRFGESYKMKPRLEELLREMGPKIVSKLKKYQDHPSLGCSECEFCNSRSTEEPGQPDLKNLSNLPCFKNPRELEKFLALSFRRMFYAEFLHFLNNKFTAGDHLPDDFDIENY